MNVSIDINDLQNLKKIEPGDVLVFYTDGDQRENVRAITEALKCFVIISPRERGSIEKMSREEFIRIGEALDILPHTPSTVLRATQ